MNAPRLLNVVVLGFFLGLASSSLSSCGAANKCDLSSCASGCCDQNGQCQAGTSTAACGTGAAVCRACALLQTCQLGVCGSSSLGGGGGSSTGGGGGSSTGGGGGSTTGGGGGSATGGGGGSVTGGGGGSVTGGGGGSVTGGGGGSTTFEVTVAKLGTGNGTVSSSPGGIDCGFDCAQFYPSGSLVTLSAVPAIGSTFVGWGGPCSGTSTCALFVTATSTVTATFSLSNTGGGGGSVTGGGGGSVTGGGGGSVTGGGGGSVTGGGGGSVTGGGGGSVTGGGGGSVTGGGGGSVTGGGGGSTGTILGRYVSLDGNSSHAANYLLGEKLVVPATVTLLKFGVLVRTAGPSVVMALYTDVNGNPGSLVAQTASTPLVTGYLEMSPLSPATLAPGTYWIMGEYSASASIGYSTSDSTNQVKYVSHAFGTTLPNPFGAPQSYTGQMFNYYLRVQ